MLPILSDVETGWLSRLTFPDRAPNAAIACTIAALRNQSPSDYGTPQPESRPPRWIEATGRYPYCSADDACCMGRCLENTRRQCIADRQWLGGSERHRQGISDRFRCCYRLAEQPICRPWFIIYKNYEQPLSSVNNAREQQKKTSEKPFS